MAPPKRKNLYNTDYEKEFSNIKRSKKGDEYAYCAVCNDDINLISIGKAALTQHHRTDKHKKSASAANRSQSISAFTTSKSAPTLIDRRVAAAEGTWAFHMCMHSHSFKSSDCSSNLFNNLFYDSAVGKKFGSASNKSAAIIKGLQEFLII